MTNKRKWKRFRNGQKKDTKNQKKKMHEKLYNHDAYYLPSVTMMILLNKPMTLRIKMRDCQMSQLLKDFEEYKRRVKDVLSID